MKVIVWIALSVLPLSALAATGVRDYLEIVQLAPISNDRPSSTVNQSLTRVYFVTSAAWGATACRTDSGDIHFDDKHLLASALMAFASGKQMKVEVDDTLATANGVCKITVLYVYR